MAKETLKQLKEQLETMRKNIRDYVTHNLYPTSTVYSTVPTVTSDKKVNMVTVAELISSAKSADSLGYDTMLNVTQGGAALQIVFVSKRKNRDFTI